MVMRMKTVLFIVAIGALAYCCGCGRATSPSGTGFLSTLRSLDQLPTDKRLDEATAAARSYRPGRSPRHQVTLAELQKLYGKRLMEADGAAFVQYDDGLLLHFVLAGDRCAALSVGKAVPQVAEALTNEHGARSR